MLKFMRLSWMMVGNSMSWSGFRLLMCTGESWTLTNNVPTGADVTPQGVGHLAAGSSNPALVLALRPRIQAIRTLSSLLLGRGRGSRTCHMQSMAAGVD